jgi:hypothetical protein
VLDHGVEISREGIFRLGNGCHPPRLRTKPSLVTHPEKELITRVSMTQVVLEAIFGG